MASSPGPRRSERSTAGKASAWQARRSSTRTACTSSTTTTRNRSSRHSTNGRAPSSGGSSARRSRTGLHRSSGRTNLCTEIVTTGMGKVRSYDLDGKLLWELGGMTINTIPTPFAQHGLVYINSGYPGAPVRPVYAIRPGASGDISLKPGATSEAVHRLGAQPLLGTYQTTSLEYGDYYYTLLDRGFLLCHDARTGTPDLWPPAYLCRVQRLLRVALGVQQQDFPAKRGRTGCVRRSGGSRVRLHPHELAQRDVVRHTSGGARKPDHPDAVETLPDRNPALNGPSSLFSLIYRSACIEAGWPYYNDWPSCGRRRAASRLVHAHEASRDQEPAETGRRRGGK